MSLFESLKRGTKRAQTAMEQSPFLQGFLRGSLDRDDYATYLESLVHVYRTLETLPEAGNPVLDVFRFPQLHRTAALEDDLRFFRGPDFRAGPPSSATFDYVRQIDRVKLFAPHRFMAHAYARYMTDLGGGRALAALVQGNLGLTGKDGIAFYRFRRIRLIDEFERMLRQRLDALQLDTREEEEAIEEAQLAFAMNQDLFEELADRTRPIEIDAVMGRSRKITLPYGTMPALDLRSSTR